MNEAPFSMNFHAFNGEGLPLQLTIRGDSLTAFQDNINSFFSRHPALGGLDMLFQSPPEGSLRPFTPRIVGWLRGHTEDRNDPNRRHPCVWLYSDSPNLEWATATVYEEKLHTLPASINWRDMDDMGNQAPAVDKARMRYNKCDFRISMVPKIGFDGKPQLNKNGKIKYVYERVLGDGETAGTSDGDGAQVDDEDFGMNGPVRNSGTARSTNTAVNKASQNAADRLKPYASGSARDDLQIGPEVIDLIKRMRSLDKSSGDVMSVDREEGGEKKRGQYNFLAGLIDRTAKTLFGPNAEPMHQEALSFILGRPINQESLPGRNCSVLIDELWPGSKTKANEKYSEATDETMQEIVNICSAIQFEQDGGSDDLPF